MPGRPRVYDESRDARRAANIRAAQRDRDRGFIQRSVALPATCWTLIRAAREPGETSDAQTLARLLQHREQPEVQPGAVDTCIVVNAGGAMPISDPRGW